jgi:hypothetical protein
MDCEGEDKIDRLETLSEGSSPFRPRRAPAKPVLAATCNNQNTSFQGAFEAIRPAFTDLIAPRPRTLVPDCVKLLEKSQRRRP